MGGSNVSDFILQLTFKEWLLRLMDVLSCCPEFELLVEIIELIMEYV